MSTLSDDERFAALIAAEFPDAVFDLHAPHSQASPATQPPTPPPPPPTAPPTPAPPTTATPSTTAPPTPTPPTTTAPPTLASPTTPAPAQPAAADPGQFRVWTPPEEPEEEFVPPPLPAAKPWSPEGKAGTGLIGFCVVIVVLSAFGVALPIWVAILAGLSLFGGTALLLHRLAKNPPPDDDGAVL